MKNVKKTYKYVDIVDESKAKCMRIEYTKFDNNDLEIFPYDNSSLVK